MTALTPTMERVLAELRRMSFPADAYQLGCSVATLEALRRRGLVEVDRVRPAIAGGWPRYDVYYRAVEAKR